MIDSMDLRLQQSVEVTNPTCGFCGRPRSDHLGVSLICPTRERITCFVRQRRNTLNEEQR